MYVRETEKWKVETMNKRHIRNNKYQGEKKRCIDHNFLGRDPSTIKEEHHEEES